MSVTYSNRNKKIYFKQEITDDAIFAVLRCLVARLQNQNGGALSFTLENPFEVSNYELSIKKVWSKKNE
jgi:hypothetical protein